MFYLVKRKICGIQYVGQTCRFLKTRFSEHFHRMKKPHKIIHGHELELKWIKLLQTPYPLGFIDNIYHEGNISRFPGFDFRYQ